MCYNDNSRGGFKMGNEEIKNYAEKIVAQNEEIKNYAEKIVAQNEEIKNYAEKIVAQNEEIKNYAEKTVAQKEEQKDYTRLIAAQNESARRLKIKGITNTLTEENKKKRGFAITSGICFAGLMAATHFSGIDPNQVIQTEIQALNSFDALKEYLAYFTPAMWGALIATATSFSKYIKHKKKYDDANQEFYDMMDNQPEDYLDVVEHQAKSR